MGGKGIHSMYDIIVLDVDDCDGDEGQNSIDEM